MSEQEIKIHPARKLIADIAIAALNQQSEIERKAALYDELVEKGEALCAELVDFRNREGVPHNAMANAAFQEFREVIRKARREA